MSSRPACIVDSTSKSVCFLTGSEARRVAITYLHWSFFCSGNNHDVCTVPTKLAKSLNSDVPPSWMYVAITPFRTRSVGASHGGIGISHVHVHADLYVFAATKISHRLWWWDQLQRRSRGAAPRYFKLRPHLQPVVSRAWPQDVALSDMFRTTPDYQCDAEVTLRLNRIESNDPPSFKLVFIHNPSYKFEPIASPWRVNSPFALSQYIQFS